MKCWTFCARGPHPLAPVTFPIGVVTAIVGVPTFLVLLRTHRR